MPLPWVASGMLWIALNCSICVQVGQAEVIGQVTPAARSARAAASTPSQVSGNWSGFRFARRKASLL